MIFVFLTTKRLLFDHGPSSVKLKSVVLCTVMSEEEEKRNVKSNGFVS